MSQAYWRLRPTEFIESGVREIAAREGKSYSATLTKLLTSALMAHQGAARRLKSTKPEVRGRSEG
jgi:hypothetical protein